MIDFILETDTSIRGLGAILSQRQADGLPHPNVFASGALAPAERNYGINDLETLTVVWALSHFHYYLYGHRVQVITDHTAVKAILDSPNPLGRHARWWTRVFGQGIKEVTIIHRSGKDNLAADALSRNPHEKPPMQGIGEDKVQVAVISSSVDISTMLNLSSCNNPLSSELQKGTLPQNKKQTRIIVAKAPTALLMISSTLYTIREESVNW